MLKFGHKQWQTVIDHQSTGFVEHVARSLRQESELFAQTHPLIVVQLASHGIARAQARGLDDSLRLAQFVHLMAEVGSEFDLCPAVLERLEDPSLSPSQRFDLLLDEADDALWIDAGRDDSLAGWYLRELCEGLTRPQRWALALGRALPPEDLPEPAVRAAIVAAAIVDAAAAGGSAADDQFVWAACACAYGPDFRHAMSWSADVFGQPRPVALVTGMLRARLAIDFAAWL